MKIAGCERGVGPQIEDLKTGFFAQKLHQFIIGPAQTCVYWQAKGEILLPVR
jgi:hypothetical protein